MADGTVRVRVTGENTGLRRTLRVARADMRAFDRTVRRVSVAVGAVTTSVTAAGYALGRLADRGGRMVTVTRAFTRATEGQAEAMETLSAASGGVISNYELMARFNQAVTLGAANTTEQFAQLTQGAISLGRAMGVDVLRSLDSLVTGVGRMSARWLDNIGVIVNTERAYEQYATSIGTTAARLDDLQRKEAFRIATLRQVNALVVRMGGNVRTGADAWLGFTTALENARDRVGEIVALAPGTTLFFDSLAAGVEAFGEALDRHQPTIEHFLAALGRIAQIGPQEALQTLIGQLRADHPILARLQDLARDFPAFVPMQRLVDSIVNSVRGTVGSVVDTLASQVHAGSLGDIRRFRAGTPTAAPPPPTIAPSPPFGFTRFDRALSVSGLGPLPSGQRLVRGIQLGQFAGAGGVAGGVGEFTPTAVNQIGLAREALRDMAPLFEDLALRIGIFGDVVEQTVDTRLQTASATVVDTFGIMAQAAITGSHNMAQAVINAFAQISQRLTGPGGIFSGFLAGPLAGPLFGAGLGILGAVIGRAAAQRPLPVSIEDITDSAASKLTEESDRTQSLSIQVVTPSGDVLDEIHTEIRRRENRDAVLRLPRGVTL